MQASGYQERTVLQGVPVAEQPITTGGALRHVGPRILAHQRDEPPTTGGITTPQALSVGVTYTTAVQKQANKVLVVAATYGLAFLKLVTKPIALGATYTVVLLKLVAKNLALGATYTVVLAALKVFQKALSVGVTYTVVLTKQANKVLVVGATYSVVLIKRANKLLILGATYTAALLKQVSKLLVLGATYTPVLAALKVFQKALSVGISNLVQLVTQFIPGSAGGDPVNEPKAILVSTSGDGFMVNAESRASLTEAEGTAQNQGTEGKAILVEV
jgi:hypothetical protein